MVTASSEIVCKYFCTLEDVENCQAAVFFAPDLCYFVSGFNVQMNSEDAKNLDGDIENTNIFYRISSDSQVPLDHQKIEKVNCDCHAISVNTVVFQKI